MNGDFSRNTFDATKHYTRVLMQQGRVQLDADWNEQASILLHYLRALAKDFFGPSGGPPNEFNIDIRFNDNGGRKIIDLIIGSGDYYVDGILCENEGKSEHNYEYMLYSEQYPAPPSLSTDNTLLVFLDVWERLVTPYEDNNIREVALGGPDTAVRAKVSWRVRVIDKYPVTEKHPDELLPISMEFDWKSLLQNNWKDWIEQWQSVNRGLLIARAKEKNTSQNPEACSVPPDAKYHGQENQLYRVEIHNGGKGGEATFKWSRENGSVFFPIHEMKGTVVYLEHLGRDKHLSLTEGDWVEVVDDNITQQTEPIKPGPLVQIDTIDRLNLMVTLKVAEDITLPRYDENSQSHPLLRRWDYQHINSDDTPRAAADGALILDECTTNIEKWLTLEKGVQVQFMPPSSGGAHHYRTGDYWLIPARTATGNVEWSSEINDNGNWVPKASKPHGVEHHYAPLVITTPEWLIDCRSTRPTNNSTSNNLSVTSENLVPKNLERTSRQRVKKK